MWKGMVPLKIKRDFNRCMFELLDQCQSSPELIGTISQFSFSLRNFEEAVKRIEVHSILRPDEYKNKAIASAFKFWRSNNGPFLNMLLELSLSDQQRNTLNAYEGWMIGMELAYKEYF